MSGIKRRTHGMSDDGKGTISCKERRLTPRALPSCTICMWGRVASQHIESVLDQGVTVYEFVNSL